ncbi:MAG: protein translocase SEC61 complex subunit gamma [Methanobrevibacter sp.]|jgi:protein transport protein SEC61 subunit gamma-like protein|nr:protein translocase SEC61 complex subunit gamma [Methanobrevibacter sp.]
MSLNESIKSFFKQCERVLKVSRKPNREEYLNFAKVTAIGIAIIGVIGFVIYAIAQFVGI